MYYADNTMAKPSFIRDSSNRNNDMKKSEIVWDNVRAMSDTNEKCSLGYYEDKAGEITMKWTMKDYEPTTQQSIIWFANMPLPLDVCRDVVEHASNMLPKASTMSLVLPLYNPSTEEETLFNHCWDFGHALAMAGPLKKLHEAANDGSPQAIAMVMKIEASMLAVNLEEDDDPTKKLMRVSIDLGLGLNEPKEE